MVMFNSYVKFPEGNMEGMEWFSVSSVFSRSSAELLASKVNKMEYDWGWFVLYSRWHTPQALVFLSLCHILCPLTLTLADAAMGTSEGVVWAVGIWCFWRAGSMLKIQQLGKWLDEPREGWHGLNTSRLVRKHLKQNHCLSPACNSLAVQLKWHQHNNLKQEACHWDHHHSTLLLQLQREKRTHQSAPATPRARPSWWVLSWNGQHHKVAVTRCDHMCCFDGGLWPLISSGIRHHKNIQKYHLKSDHMLVNNCKHFDIRSLIPDTRPLLRHSVPWNILPTSAVWSAMGALNLRAAARWAASACGSRPRNSPE